MTKSTASATVALHTDVTVEVATQLLDQLTAIRGIHAAFIVGIGNGYIANEPLLSDKGNMRVYFRGTVRGVLGGKNHLAFSGLQSADEHDHDHDACIAYAAKQGVPAAWAHRVETYLSM